MLEWKLVGEKVGIDRYNMNAYTQVTTLTAIFRICYFLFITETPPNYQEYTNEVTSILFNFVPRRGGRRRFGYLILNAKPREGK